ncbi:shikimate kinase [Mastigocoleus sp. MO_188.B34]|uniref:shikimate kinase n=1 Tax=Mastigocoleus sp. MO_188.B34 TaxID=3036635 RepID=UPI002625CB2E|nr:shikimate kinase [Mastigocoleus sp. MO_188.B34]MDJ0694529.1 dephospho-CoA kinase [Mastigocoleus sp. MO_188.B34]
MRISIIGGVGSGKTTLAKQISQSLTIPHIELDYLYWESNWVRVPKEIFRERVADSLTEESWVVDGQYSKVRDIIWSRADTVVWLDYSLVTVMSRITKRSLNRIITKQEVCNGNYETWRKLFSNKSIILHSFKSYHKRRKKYPILFKKPENSHLNIVHLQSPKATQDWLLNLT